MFTRLHLGIPSELITLKSIFNNKSLKLDSIVQALYMIHNESSIDLGVTPACVITAE